MPRHFSYTDLIERVADLARLALVPEPGERTALASSYDRASRYDAENDRYLDWGANADGTGLVRQEGECEVLAEINGAGCIWRIWAATVGEGHVRIYLDGAAVPAIDLPFAGYFNRQHEPFTRASLVYKTTAQGYNSYTPIPFQRSCRIVADRGWGKYYHFNYTLFAPGTTVPTFTRRLAAAESSALDALDARLQRCGDDAVDPVEEDAGRRTCTRVITVASGQSAVVADWSGAGEIVALRVNVELPENVDAQRRRLRELAIEITWDDEPQPAVWSPLGDFFGCAAGAVPFRTLPVGLREDGSFYCFWRMPYTRRAVIRVHNDGAAPVLMAWSIDQVSLAHPPAAYLRFHAKWHRDVLPVRADRAPDWTVLRTQGTGRLVGTQLHVWNPRGGWWGEGDEKFFVDGEKFPSTFGTGTEDYLGYAWSSGETFVQALHSQPVNQNNRGHVSANRWHIPDDVPFERSLEATIEKYFSNANPCHWAAVTYWYLVLGGADPFGAVPVAERVGPWTWPPIWREDGVLEAESLPVRKEQWQFAGSPLDAVYWNLPVGAVSNDRLLVWWVDKPGCRLELGGFTVPQPGRYRVFARWLRSHEMGQLQFDLAGQRLGGPIDLYAPTKGVPPRIGEAELLGEVELSAGEHVLGVETVGKNAESTGYLMGVDYFRLSPVS